MPAVGQLLDITYLAQRIRDRKVIPIVGPDLIRVPAGAGSMRLDEWLGERLLSTAGDARAPSSTPPPTEAPAARAAPPRLAEAAAVVLRSLGNQRPLLEERFRPIMREAHALPVPHALLRLASIRGLRLFLTQTIDGFLAKAVRQARAEERVVVIHDWPYGGDIPDLYANLHGPVVYQLCGGFRAVEGAAPEESQDYVLTDSHLVDRLHALSGNLRDHARLQQALRDQDLLFLGCGYEDWLQRMFIRAVSGCPLSEGRRRKEWVVDQEAAPDRAFTVFLTRCGAITWGSGSPETFVEELADACGARPTSGRVHVEEAADPPARPAPQDPPVSERAAELRRRVEEQPPSEDPVALFISYAHEDWMAAFELYLQLREAGIPAWLDAARLKGGESLRDLIHERIKTCAVFVPLLSDAVVAAGKEKRWFRQEWEWARAESLQHPQQSPLIRPLNIDGLSPGTAAIDPAWMKSGIKWYAWRPHPSAEGPAQALPALYVEGLRETYQRARERYRRSEEQRRGKGSP